MLRSVTRSPDGSPPTDAASKLAASGDDDGVRVGAHERRLRLLLGHLAGRAVRARFEIDDLLQEVYVRAFAQPDAIPKRDASDPEDAALGRWLTRLARNAVIDAARAIRAAKRDGTEIALVRSDSSRSGLRASALAARTGGPPTRLGTAEELARIQGAFDGLTAEHRRVIGLRQFEGLSAREAAARMGRSETAVHSLYRRALAAWEEAMETR